MTGPEETRLNQALHGAHSDTVYDAGTKQWNHAAALLKHTADELEAQATNGRITTMHGLSGPALIVALKKAVHGLNAKADDLTKGATALDHAATAIHAVSTERQNMDATYPAMADPGPRKTAQPGDDPSTIAKTTQHNQSVTNYETTMQQRETRSKQLADHIDTVYASSTETMKQISGYQDPPPVVPPSASSGTGTGVHSTGFTLNHASSNGGNGGNHGGNHGGGLVLTTHHGGHHPPTHPPKPPTTEWPPFPPPPHPGPVTPHPTWPGGPGGPGDPGSPGNPVTPGTPSSPGGHLDTGVVGGLVAGGLIGAGGLTAALRNGNLSVPGLSRSSVNGIGESPEALNQGVLGRPPSTAGLEEGVGRPGAAGTVSEGEGTSAVTGRSGGVGGVGGGSRSGGAGGRGAGSGGRGKDKKRGKTGDRDLFDDGQDWLDDEGVAPPVLG